MTSNNKKINKKAHFNVIDAVIIVLVISMALGLYFRLNIVERLWEQTKTEDYVIGFSIEDIRYTTPDYLSVDDKVYFADDGELFGVLLSESENANALNIAPASMFLSDSAGNMIEVFYPNEESRVDVKGRLLCQGYYAEDGGFNIGGRHYISPGQSILVRTELVTVTMNITSVELYIAE